MDNIIDIINKIVFVLASSGIILWFIIALVKEIRASAKKRKKDREVTDKDKNTDK